MHECEDYSHHEAEKCDNLPWEDHPYDTPDEEEVFKTESDDLEDDVVFQDISSCMAEEEVKWEDSPYYRKLGL